MFFCIFFDGFNLELVFVKVMFVFFCSMRNHHLRGEMFGTFTINQEQIYV